MDIIDLESSDPPGPRSAHLFVSSSPTPTRRRFLSVKTPAPKLSRSAARSSPSSLPSIIEITSSPLPAKRKRHPEQPSSLSNAIVLESGSESDSEPAERKKKIALPSSPTGAGDESVLEIDPVGPSDDIQLGSIFDISTKTAITPSKPKQPASAVTPASTTEGPEGDLDELLEHAKKFKSKELKQVNKMQRTKDELLAEMSVEIETRLHAKLAGINADFESFLAPIKVDTASLYLPLIQFKRQVEAVYHEQKGTYVPIDKYMKTESTVVLYYDAAELVDKIRDDTLRTIILKVKRMRQDANVVLMINGYQQHLQTLRAQHNRAFVSQVMRKMDHGKTQRVLGPANNTVSAETVRKKLVELEVFLGIHIFPIKGLRELVDWIRSFSYTMAQKNYDPHERNRELANIGNIRCGQTPEECYQESLKQLKYLVTSSARTLAKKYPTLVQLADKLQTGVPSLIRTDVEQNLRKVFTCTDPNELLD
ncbi:hypothetical protein KL938_005059 [Ogataea parapolymorpha]|nr:hypothetical protein KL938_005059 [Ogataea parapolymorpha]